jgi:D-sedoheptulose 7-phosphate isomerase
MKKNGDNDKAPFTWGDQCSAVALALGGLEACGRDGALMAPDAAFASLLARTERLRNEDGTLFLAGNGASASLASHSAVDLMKNAGLKAVVLTDPALVTAWANDLSYEEVFAAPLGICLRRPDLLVLISSSGQSPNMLAAARAARAKGAWLLTLSAMRPDNPLRRLGDLNFYLPADTYGLAESAHTVVLHHWIDLETGARSRRPKEDAAHGYDSGL